MNEKLEQLLMKILLKLDDAIDNADTVGIKVDSLAKTVAYILQTVKSLPSEERTVFVEFIDQLQNKI